MTFKQLAIDTAVVLGVLALAFILWEFHEAVILFIFSLAIAAAARPYVEALARRGVPSVLALILVYVSSILLLAIIFWAVGGTLLHETQTLTDRMALTYEQMWRDWPQGTQFEQMVIQRLPAPDVLYKIFSPAQPNSAINSVLGFTITSATLFGQVATVLMLSIYWSIDRVHFERLWLSLLPVQSRASARDIWRAIERDFGEYIRSQLLQSLAAGVLLGLGFYFIGLQYPVLLAVFAALVWLIPWLGGVLVVLPVAVVGFSQSLGLGIFATVFVIGVLFLLDFLIQPRFMRRAQFSSLLSILLIIALVEPFGLMGFIVAPPLAAAIELIFRYNLQARPVSTEVKSDEQIKVLRERILQIRQAMANSPEPPEPQMNSLVNRLENLLERADQAIG